MAIKSKTYPITGNYIQASELAYTTIYVVKKDGVHHDRYTTDANRSYIYDQSIGRITFLTSGEKAFVIYKESSGMPEPIPGICTPVTIQDSDMPNAVVNVSYSKAFPLDGTAPFTLNIIQKPAWAAVNLSLMNVVTVMGFPDVAGPEVLEFSVTNCEGGGTDSVLKNFSTLANSNNIFISAPSISRIQSISGITFVITGGSFPVYLSNSITGIHPTYTGTITVAVTNIIFPKTLRLSRNSIQLEAIAITSNGNYTFASQVYLSTDTISIILN